jgi:hypothetical protein
VQSSQTDPDNIGIELRRVESWNAVPLENTIKNENFLADLPLEKLKWEAGISLKSPPLASRNPSPLALPTQQAKTDPSPSFVSLPMDHMTHPPLLSSHDQPHDSSDEDELMVLLNIIKKEALKLKNIKNHSRETGH